MFTRLEDVVVTQLWSEDNGNKRCGGGNHDDTLENADMVSIATSRASFARVIYLLACDQSVSKSD